jgi:hypothetical protein
MAVEKDLIVAGIIYFSLGIIVGFSVGWFL